MTEARLDGAALTDEPSYGASTVEVRDGAVSRPPLRGILRMAVTETGRMRRGCSVSRSKMPTDETRITGIVEATRLLSIAGKPLVDAYLRGGADCPEAIRDEAVIRTAGHVQGSADVRRAGRALESRAPPYRLTLSPAAAGSVRQSGAAALLAPYVRRSA